MKSSEVMARIAALAVLAAGLATAAPITGAQATKAVSKWATMRPAAHLDARLGTTVASSDVVTSGGTNLFHVVKLSEGGYVITSADDRIQPIIAFSEDDDLVRDRNNPLWVMLNEDLPRRIAAVEAVAAAGNMRTSSATALASSARTAENAWADLLADEEKADNTDQTAKGVSSVADVRVPALMETKWDQSTVGVSTPCYNLYTPNGYVCGCVATAGAQVMRYHRYPTASVAAKAYSCWVDDSAVSKTMKGGTYAWSSMPGVPTSSTALEQRQAIGKLCYDVGVASRMNWGADGSGATPALLAQALVDTFGYSSTKCHMDSSISSTVFERAIYANLDAGYPVLLGINNSAGNVGHEIVADGYGYSSGNVYTHLNLGWSGSYNAWYALPSIDAGYAFSIINSIVYNVFPTSTGELLTGRVVDTAGNPISGASVQAVNGTTVRSANTNARGIYALNVAGGKTWTVTVAASGYAGADPKSVYVSSSSSATLAAVYATSYSYYRDGVVGNSWGNNFTLAAEAQKPNLRVDVAFLSSESGSCDEVSSSTSFTRGETIYLYAGWTNDGEGTAAGPFVVRHELLNSSGTVLETWNYTWSDDHEPCRRLVWESSTWSGLQGLDVGSYAYRITVDPEGVVAETNEADNSRTVQFTVAEPEPEVSLETVEISGPSSISAGGRTNYVCRALLSDGTEVSATPIWTIDSGADYASVDADGVVTAGVPTSRRSVVLRATCTYRDVSKSATKTISIGAAIALPTALDNTELAFTTGGDAPWFGQTEVTDDGVDAARSGALGNSGVSWMETTVTGPGTLTFRYRVSSEARYDKLTFSVDGTEAMQDSGTTGGWADYTAEFAAGTHAVRWQYAKDVSYAYGLDAAFVDQVRWTPLATPSALVIEAPASVAAGQSAQLTCRAAMSDGTSKLVGAAWSISAGSAYASVDSSGLFRAFASTVARTATVMATYEENGVAKSATRTIAISAVIPPPGAPMITVAGAGDENAARIAWTGASNAITYNVYRSRTEVRPASPVASGLVSTEYADTAAEPGVAFTYWVSAVNSTGETVGEPREAYRTVSLAAEPANVTFDHGGGTATIRVKSNASWNPVTHVAWMQMSCSDETLSMTAAANDGEEVRAVSVYVTAGIGVDYPATVELVVTQNGRPHDDGMPDFAFRPVPGTDASRALFVTDAERGMPKRLFEAGEPVFLRYRWGNAGTAAAEGLIVTGVSLRNSAGEAISTDWRMSAVALAAGAEEEVSLDCTAWRDLEPGVYQAHVLLDANNDFDELDKDNNIESFWFAVRDPVTLEEALDTSALSFSAADEGWYGTLGMGKDGDDAAMTRLMEDGGSEVLRAAVTGAGTLSFAYRTSTEAGYDTLTFAVDGRSKLVDSGLGAWRTVEFEVGEGAHAFTWTYAKDGGGSAGDDCVYLDRVVWTPVRTGEPPADFAATDGSYPNYVSMTWTASQGAKAYVIERSESVDGPWTKVYEGALRRANDATALGGVEYLYRIKAVYADGESDWSEPEQGWRKASIDYQSQRSLPGSGGADGVEVGANAVWRASANADWVVFDTAEGIGNGKLLYHVARNDSGAERTAVITLTAASGTGHEYERTFKVLQHVPVDLGVAVPLNEAADCPLQFSTSGDAAWVGQTRISHDGRSALRSGEISSDGKTRIETTLGRAGTLTFWWTTSSQERYDTLAVYVGTNKVAEISGCTYRTPYVKEWEQVTLSIPQGGAVVAWEYSKNQTVDRYEDAGFVDQIVWTPADALPPIAPDDWWNRYPGLLARLGVSTREEAFRMRSPGDLGSGGKSTSVWEDYVAGTDPLDSRSVFTAMIEIRDGRPVVRWSPELPATETRLRNYTTYGRRSLSDSGWEPVPEGMESDYKFFKVSVEMK